MVPEGARWYQRVPDDAKGCQMVPESARGCQRVPEGASGCQMVPAGARWCQIGTVVAPGLGKASDLIFVTVSIAGVEVVALVDTGATTSCCRWEWYQKWKDHLGAVIKSKLRIIGIGPDPIKIKGLTRPLTLIIVPPFHCIFLYLSIDIQGSVTKRLGLFHPSPSYPSA